MKSEVHNIVPTGLGKKKCLNPESNPAAILLTFDSYDNHYIMLD
jgi:hypothetical protein